MLIVKPHDRFNSSLCEKGHETLYSLFIGHKFGELSKKPRLLTSGYYNAV